MPTHKLGEFIRRLEAMEKKLDAHLEESVDIHKKLAKLDTNQVWLMKIICGAAGLGFLEKIIGWIVR
jgi:hypothetical protein